MIGDLLDDGWFIASDSQLQTMREVHEQGGDIDELLWEEAFLGRGIFGPLIPIDEHGEPTMTEEELWEWYYNSFTAAEKEEMIQRYWASDAGRAEMARRSVQSTIRMANYIDRLSRDSSVGQKVGGGFVPVGAPEWEDLRSDEKVIFVAITTLMGSGLGAANNARKGAGFVWSQGRQHAGRAWNWGRNQFIKGWIALPQAQMAVSQIGTQGGRAFVNATVASFGTGFVNNLLPEHARGIISELVGSSPLPEVLKQAFSFGSLTQEGTASLYDYILGD